MIQREREHLSELYEADETARLEAMADLISRGKTDELDFDHLREFLADMGRRDRRTVQGRLTVLLTHQLKWEHPPGRRTRGWKTTIITQRQNLLHDVGSGFLRHDAQEDLAAAYTDAVERSTSETSLPAGRFPADCPYTLDERLTAVVHDAY
jgi:hypothetical protein